MLNKKGQGLSLGYVVGAILFGILMSMIIIFLVFTGDSFNPEEDVCMEWKSHYECDNYNCREYENFDLCVEENKYCEEIKECGDWRSKTKCEIDPNAEGCICDEYISETDSNYGIMCDSNGKNNNPYLIEECGNGKIEDGCCYPCIKAHEPTECQLKFQEMKQELNEMGCLE